MNRTTAARTPALALAVALIATAAAPARADDLADYDPSSQAWNGLSSFVGLAGGMGYEVRPMAALEWKDLGAEDILVLIYPLRRVDPNKLDAFIRVGGHVVVADDFGDSREAVSRLELIRGEVGTPQATKFHEGHPFAPIATPIAPGHPIATQIKEVITNHPAVLTRVLGATPVIGFNGGEALVVAGERGTGRFVVVSDPSVFINLMQEFEGNAQLAANILRWLDRGGRARHVVILRGDVPMYGKPRPFIDDAGAGPVGRAVNDLNDWLSHRSDWLLTPVAMRIVAAVMALVLVTLVVLAMPLRKQTTADGSWLKFIRPGRRDAPDKMIAAAEVAAKDRGGVAGWAGFGGMSRAKGDDNLLTAACVLRDLAQGVIGRAIQIQDPIYSMTETELVGAVSRVKDPYAGAQVARVYRRLRALPSRSQAAAPWGAGAMPRREFDRLYAEVTELCRTLGEEL
jgi:hypothetical protein